MFGVVILVEVSMAESIDHCDTWQKENRSSTPVDGFLWEVQKKYTKKIRPLFLWIRRIPTTGSWVDEKRS